MGGEAMSHNIEVAVGVIDAFNRRDLDTLDELCIPDYEWFPAMAWTVDGESYRGREGFERYLVAVGESWGELLVHADQCRDLGDRVLLLGRAEGMGRGSGVPIDAPLGMVVDIREGKLSRARSFLDHGEAMKAAGLTE
ncbi:MAG TPA: nuclear transport factor 2 family protein [Solirubrobacteraceae bacterium]|nr:nuclear transport factor 2 family protein [Solirubrobacteraceae bacterium]